MAGEGAGDGVEGGEAVVAGGCEVGVDQAPAVEGVVGLPVAGDGLVSFGGFDAAFGGVGGPVDVEVFGEVPDLFGVAGEPGGQGVAGVVAVVPVAVPVVDGSAGDGFVVAVS